MNGRSARKRLMKNRVTSFWGKRAYLTFRINPKAFPEFRPSMEKFKELIGEVRGFEGHYFKKLDDKFGQTVMIGNPFSGCNPLERLEENENPEDYLFIEEDKYGGWSWWEVRLVKSPLDKSKNASDDEVEVYHHTDEGFEWLKEVVETYKNRKEWDKKYLQNGDKNWAVTLIGSTIEECNWYSKTYYIDEHDGWYYLTFSVKYFYPERMLRFCNAAKRLSKALNKAGYPTKVN